MDPLYLIAYDIAHPRRRGRIHRFLKQWAIPVQYSVFIAPCSEVVLAEIVDGLRQRMEPRQDDIRLYHLPRRCQPRLLGRQWLPPGVLLGEDPALIELQREHDTEPAQPPLFPTDDLYEQAP